MRIFNINNNSFQLNENQGKLTLKHVRDVDNIAHVSKLRTKQYIDSNCCDITSIVRDGKNDKCTTMVNSDTKEPIMFNINLKNNSSKYDELKISGLYNAGKPSSVNVSVTERNMTKNLNELSRNTLLIRLQKDLKLYSNMTQKLLKKSIEFVKNSR